MRHPLATPAALLLNESLVITRPAARLRPGWMGMSLGLHLLAGAAVFVAPLFQMEKLAPPQLRTDFVIPVTLGGYTPPPPKGDPLGSRAEEVVQKPEREKIMTVPPLAPTVLRPPEIAESPNEPGVADNSKLPYGDPKGEVDGTGKVGEIGTGDPSMLPGKGDGTDGPFTGILPATYPVSNPPVLISHEEPAYPETARVQGIEGAVYLQVVVDEEGRVADAHIIRSDNALFNNAALAAVKRWKYTSPRADGRVVRVYKTVTMRFTLH